MPRDQMAMAGAGRPRKVGGGPVQGNVNREMLKLAIAEKPGNLPQLEARTKLGKTTVWRWVTDMHEAGEVHITLWTRTRDGGPFKATYSAGPGVDAPCNIKPYSEAQKSKRFYKKVKEKRDELRHVRAAALANADRMSKTRDPIIEALFGPARRSTTTEAV